MKNFFLSIFMILSLVASSQEFDWAPKILSSTTTGQYVKSCDFAGGQVVANYLPGQGVALYRVNSVGGDPQDLPSYILSGGTAWFDVIEWNSQLVLSGVETFGQGNPSQTFVKVLNDGAWQSVATSSPEGQTQNFLGTKGGNLYLVSSDTDNTTIYLLNQQDWISVAELPGIVEDVISPLNEDIFVVTRSTSQTLEGVWRFDGVEPLEVGNVEELGASGVLNRTRLHFNPLTQMLWISSRMSGQGCFAGMFLGGQWYIVGSVGPLDANNDIGFTDCWQTPVRVCSMPGTTNSVVEIWTGSSWESISNLSFLGSAIWSHTTPEGNFRVCGNSPEGLVVQRLLVPPCCPSVPSNVCPEDIDLDGLVNTQDLIMLLGVFGSVCQ